MHTLLDLRGNIPTLIHITDGKMHEINVLDILIPEAGFDRLSGVLFRGIKNLLLKFYPPIFYISILIKN